MVKHRTPPQIPAHHSQHPFAPGVIDHHKRRHLRSLARWFGRVLGLLLMAAVLAAAVNLFQRGGV
jgi:hypothetical protein